MYADLWSNFLQIEVDRNTLDCALRNNSLIVPEFFACEAKSNDAISKKFVPIKYGEQFNNFFNRLNGLPFRKGDLNLIVDVFLSSMNRRLSRHWRDCFVSILEVYYPEEIFNMDKFKCARLFSQLISLSARKQQIDDEIFQIDRDIFDWYQSGDMNIVPVGDLHEDGAITLKLFDSSNTIYLKKRDGASRTFLEQVISSANLCNIKLPSQLYSSSTLTIEEHVDADDEIETNDMTMAILQLEALSFALNLDDLHDENVLAKDGNIYVVDYESFFEPYIFGNSGLNALKGETSVGSVFTPRNFRAPEFRGFTRKFDRGIGGKGISVISPNVRLNISQCSQVYSLAFEVMRIAVKNIERNDQLSIRLIPEWTKLYLDEAIAFSNCDSASLSVYEEWLMQIDDRTSDFSDLSQFDPKYNLYCILAAALGYIPTFYHNLRGEFFFELAGKRTQMNSPHTSGLASLLQRKENFTDNLKFNVNMLFFLYNGMRPDGCSH